MTERIINPDDYLSDIVATRRYAYLDADGELRFTDYEPEATANWWCEVVVGDHVPKTLPLKPPLGWEDEEPPYPGESAAGFTFPRPSAPEPRSMYPGWMLRLRESRNGVEIVVASIVAGTAGAFIGFAIALTH